MTYYQKYKQCLFSLDSSQLLRLKNRQNHVVNALFNENRYDELGEECVKLKLIERELTDAINRELNEFKLMTIAKVI